MVLCMPLVLNATAWTVGCRYVIVSTSLLGVGDVSLWLVVDGCCMLGGYMLSGKELV